MRLLWKLGLWVFAGATGTVCSGVPRLNNETFHAHLEANPLTLVAFCVPWYEPCQKLYPELDSAGAVLAPKAISVVSVNCTAEVKLCNQYNVTSYPALRVFRGPTTITRFRENRKAKAIVSYLLRQILPRISVVAKDNIEELKSIDMPLVIAFVEKSDEASYEVFDSISEQQQDRFLFGTTQDRSLFKLGSIDFPYIVLQSPSDHISRIYRGAFTHSQVKNFLDSTVGPLIGKFSMETYYAYTQSELPLLHIFAITEAERQDLAETLQHVAEKCRGDINFATIDAKAYGFFSEALGLQTGIFPALVIEDVLSGDTVPFDQSLDITADAVGTFIDNYFDTKKSVRVEEKDESHDEL